MKLQRLRIDQLRQFRKPLEISGFAPGINLFSGPNESGKSTLVRAIRAAFFERHRSNSVEDLQPWGDTSAAPLVELDFEYQSQIWRLKKSFLQHKRCDLSIENQHLSGEDAENKLAAMFGFRFPGKGASKAQHWGIPGLLWIEQGMGQDLRDAVVNAGDHLKSALSASLGAVTSTGGDEIINDVEALRAMLLTKTGKPTGEYNDIKQKLLERQAVLQALDEKIVVYQKQVDRLGELRSQQAGDEADRPWDALRSQQQAAQDQYTQVERLAQQQSSDQQALDNCQRNIELLTSHLAGFQAQAGDLEMRRQARDLAAENLLQLREQLATLLAGLEQARSGYDIARNNERRVRQQARRHLLSREHEQLGKQLERVMDNRVKARQIQDELLTQQKELTRNRIDVKDLVCLRKLDSQRKELEVRQQSIATRLRFTLEPGRSIQLDGLALSGSGERLLLQETEIGVAGIGRFRIAPGGEDLGELLRKLERTRESFTALLGQMQVDSLEQAEQRAELYKFLQSAIAGNEKLLASHASKGIEALDAEQSGLRQRMQQLHEELADLSQTSDPLLPGPDEAEQLLNAADLQLKAAEKAERQQQTLLAKAEQALNGASNEYQKLQAQLDDPQRQQREHENARRLVDLRAQESILKTDLAQRAARIAAARPEMLLQDIKRYGDSAEQVRAAYNIRREELIHIQAQLQSLEADGLEEQRAKVASEFESLNRRHNELHCRAEALNLLVELLASKRQALTLRLQAPLQKHLNHYLQLLFSQASLDVDENLIPGQLVRHGANGMEAGDFDALSFGAREQMGLISRLAYADLLQESGRPTLIILDDALVHSDQQRLSQMKRILFDAARRHQILLFTCHPENWRDLGVAARDMQSFFAT